MADKEAAFVAGNSNRSGWKPYAGSWKPSAGGHEKEEIRHNLQNLHKGGWKPHGKPQKPSSNWGQKKAVGPQVDGSPSPSLTASVPAPKATAIKASLKNAGSLAMNSLLGLLQNYQNSTLHH